MVSTTRYIRECGSCFAYAGSNDPKEERLFRDCPFCKKPMFLLSGMIGKAYIPLGRPIELPPSYKAPMP